MARALRLRMRVRSIGGQPYGGPHAFVRVFAAGFAYGEAEPEQRRLQVERKTPDVGNIIENAYIYGRKYLILWAKKFGLKFPALTGNMKSVRAGAFGEDGY